MTVLSQIYHRILLTLSAIILSAGYAIADDGHTLTAAADSAYNADDYTAALSLYTQAAEHYGTSAILYTNIGNCEYRLGHPGKAILAYRRALRLDPTDSYAKDNLEFVNSRIVDRIGERGSFLSNTIDTVTGSATPDTWAWLAFVSFALLLGAASLYIFTDRYNLRKAGFFGGIAMLFVTIALIYLTLRSASQATDNNIGVITAPSTILSTSPRQPKDRTEEAMLLHEGTQFVILDSVSATPGDSIAVKWYDVQIDNNHRAWINSSDIERL